MSPRAAETLLTGADPKMPPKKRVINTDAAFLLVAVPIEKRPRQNTAGSKLHLRPQISEIGAQHSGPRAKPTLFCYCLVMLPDGRGILQNLHV